MSISKGLVYVISGAVSNILQPNSRGFSIFEGDQRSMFESASGGYVSVCVHVIDQNQWPDQWLCLANKFCLDEPFDVKVKCEIGRKQY